MKGLGRKIIGGVIYAAAVLMLPYIITTLWQGKIDTAAKESLGRTVVVKEDRGSREISFEEYMTGVVAGQIDASYEIEAIKAQAILTRSFLCGIMEKQQMVDETTLRLDYYDKKRLAKAWGDAYENNYEKIRQAVRETQGQIMTYDGRAAEGVYHKLSAGMTRDGTKAYPYLVPVASPKDLEADDFVTIKEYSFIDFIKIALRLEDNISFSNGEAIALQVVETDAAGYVKSAMIGTKTYDGERIMEAFELPSCAFTFQTMDNKVRIICNGIGYGYGMSQYGADRMAKDGSSAQEILKYYFPGVEIGEWKE